MMGARARRSALVGALASAAVCLLCTAALPASALAGTGFSGYVTNLETGKGIAGAEVCWFSASTEKRLGCKSSATNSAGEYTIEGLEGGEYKVGFSASNFVGQYYAGASNLFEATPISVEANKITASIDAQLLEAGEGTIVGRVTSASGGAGIAGVEVCAYGGFGEEFFNACAETGPAGEYTLSHVKSGAYFVDFRSAQSCEEELGEKIRCNDKVDVLPTGLSNIKVHANKTETANAVLAVGGQIAGTVTNASLAHPAIAHVEVCADQVNSEGHVSAFGGCAYANAAGQYTIMGLPTGSYKVEFDGYICHVVKKGEDECPQAYITQYYAGKPTPNQATAIAVSAGATTANINESLREAFPTAPSATAPPTLTGAGTVGQTLTCSPGSFAHEPLFLTYQWERSGVVIAGQSASTYTVQAADEGSSITCVVTVGNGAGFVSLASSAIAVAAPLATVSGATLKGKIALLHVSCTGAAPCTGTLKLSARARVGRRFKVVVIATAHYTVEAGKSAVVRVKLNPRGGAALRKAGKRGLIVKIAGAGLKGRSLHLKGKGKGAKGRKRHGKKH